MVAVCRCCCDGCTFLRRRRQIERRQGGRPNGRQKKRTDGRPEREKGKGMSAIFVRGSAPDVTNFTRIETVAHLSLGRRG